METFDRRKFLKSVLCGAGLMIVGSRPLSLLANPSVKKNPADTSASALLLKQFEEARTFFHKKQFVQSEQLYKTMLTELPAHISIYDCYKNLLSHQNRTDEIIPYFKQAIAKYPRRADFYDRLAKIYREIATGNKKIEKRVCQAENESDLLQTALGWYDRAIEHNPDKKFLYFGMLDTLCARSRRKAKVLRTKARSVVPDSDLPEMDEREKQLTTPYLQEWIDRKNPQHIVAPQGRAFNTVFQQVGSKVNEIQTKKRRVLYAPAEIACRADNMKQAVKMLNTDLQHYYCNVNDFPAMATLTREILNSNPDETQVLGTARKYLKKAARWDLQVEIYTQRAGDYKDFCTQWGLAYAHLQNGSVVKAGELFENLKTKVKQQSARKIGMLYGGLCACADAKGDCEETKRLLLEGIQRLEGIGGVATSLLLKYAECVHRERGMDPAIGILRKRLDPQYPTDVDDPVLKYIAPDLGSSPELFYLHQYHRKNKTMHNEEKVSILCAIAKIQEKERDKAGFDETIREIDNLIPAYSFIKKHRI